MTSTKPNCFILGGQKCGSTWLANRLGQHPDVFMADHEIHYFDKLFNFKKGDHWYEQHFMSAGPAKVIAEKTPEYMWAGGVGGRGQHAHNHRVHELIHQYNPNAKFIVVLRDPVHRAESAFNHMVNYGYIPPWTNHRSFLFGAKKSKASGFGILEKGDYFAQLSAYHSLFNQHQFLIFEFRRDLIGRPKKTLQEVCKFLEIESNFKFRDLDKTENTVEHSTLGKFAMWILNNQRIAYRLDCYFPSCKTRFSDDTKSELKQYYHKRNELLFEMIGNRFSWND